MKSYNNATRGYVRMTDVYPIQRHDIEYEIMFGFYPSDTEEGNVAEMGMRWYSLGSKERSARLESYYDSWEALHQMQDVLYVLSNLKGKSITPKEFCALLDSLGFKDKSGE